MPRYTAEVLVYREALKYLKERVPSEAALGRTLHAGERHRTMPALYKRLLISLTNRRGMPNSIGSIDNLRSVLCGFSAAKVIVEYKDWSALFRTIKTEVRPAARMEMNVPQNYWVVFCKGALEGAHFLAGHGTLRGFHRFVGAYASNEAHLIKLPRLISKRVHGFGFALACDFLKESGFKEFVKPDVHVRKILHGLRLSEPDDESLFHAMVTIARKNRVTPYVVDKVLWLIGSGYLPEDGVTFPTNRSEFIAHTGIKLRALR